MANKSIVSNTKLDALAQAIATKSGATLPLTVDGMKTAVDSIETGGGDLLADRMLDKIESYETDAVKNIPQYIFFSCLKLKTAKFTKAGVITIGNSAFYLSGIADIQFPNAESITIDNNAFFRCMSLTSFSAPVSNIGTYSFQACVLLKKFVSTYTNKYIPAKIGISAFYQSTALETVDFMTAPEMSAYAFAGCSKLAAFVIRDADNNPPTLSDSAFQGTKIANGEGYIYVPDEKVDSYKSATNWAVYANQIHPLSEYTEE